MQQAERRGEVTGERERRRERRDRERKTPRVGVSFGNHPY